MKIITIYDGTIQAKTALNYGIEKIREKGGELIVLQVFQSSLFLDYGAGPRAEELARAEVTRYKLEAEKIIRESGQTVAFRMVIEEGDPDRELLRVAEREHADLVLATPRYKRVSKSAPCPVYIMPGAILVPVDNSGAIMKDLDMIIREAKATGSRVLVMGVVPIHLYSKEETKELEELRKSTEASVTMIRQALSARGAETSGVIRSGYPDEEILKASDEYSASMIMLPEGGKTPSELAKAAAMLLDEQAGVRMPILLLPAGA
jgi:nucleotide-binding universal stress UspA family protein